MKILFLDFDGVLNSDKYVRNCGHFGVIIDPSRMELLKKIINETDAKIVLSTSWREHWSSMPDRCDETGTLINNIFKRYGLEIFDKTPDLNFKREEEIKAWLNDYPLTENFVVFDDEFLDATGFLKGHFIKTSNLRDGLDEENVCEAVKILKG